MCDVEKILKNFEDDLNSKTQKEKIAYLRSFGFQVSDKKREDNLKSRKISKKKLVMANT